MKFGPSPAARRGFCESANVMDRLNFTSMSLANDNYVEQC